jgi:hypothetical protein
MANEAEIAAQAAEQEKVKAEAEAKAVEEAKVKVEAEAKNNATVGDILGDAGKGKEKKDGKMVPEAVLIETKKALKEAKDKIKDMEDAGATKKEISQSIKDIADEHNVDPEFLEKIVKVAKKEAKDEMEAEVSSKMKPLEEKEQKASRDKIFAENYDKTIEALPEYKDLAQKEVIKALALNPDNKDKTFAQIFEMAYGHLVKGKKGLDSSKPKGGQDPSGIDYDKAGTDAEYYREIMADPKLKAEYNKRMLSNMKL